MLNTQARDQLRTLLPGSMIATKQWLRTQGLSPYYLDNAVRSGLLTPLTPGVFSLLPIKPSWQGVVASLQKMSSQPVHIGGLSALMLAGLAHYLSLSSTPGVHLFSPEPLPRWLARISVDANFEWHGTRRLWDEALLNDAQFLKQQEWQSGCPEITFSCPERAILEVLLDVPDGVSFEHADALMQGLHNLSPRKLDVLLMACCNIKVKRLFLWLAERHTHAWFRYLTPEQYDLGSGKRVVAKEGRLEKHWQITVPKEM